MVGFLAPTLGRVFNTKHEPNELSEQGLSAFVATKSILPRMSLSSRHLAPVATGQFSNNGCKHTLGSAVLDVTHCVRINNLIYMSGFESIA